MPVEYSRDSVIEPDFVKTLLPEEWLDDPDRPYLLFQHYPLLTAEKVQAQRDAFASDYAPAAADSLNRLYIYTSDKYYKMHFDGGERAHLIDKVGREDLGVFKGAFTVLIHLPTGQIVNKTLELMNPYLLCDWLVASKQMMYPLRDPGWTRKQPQLRNLGNLNARPHRDRLPSRLLDTLAASTPIYSIQADSIGSDAPYILLDPVDIVQIPMPDTTSQRRFFSVTSLDDRRLVVTDIQNERMEMFTYPELGPMKRWPRGFLPGQFARASSVEAGNGELIVYDRRNNRLEWLGADFRSKAMFPLFSYGMSSHGHVITNKGVARLHTVGSDSSGFRSRFAVYPPDKSPLRVLDGDVHEVRYENGRRLRSFPILTGNRKYSVLYSPQEPYLWVYDADLNPVATFCLSGAYADSLFELSASSRVGQRRRETAVDPISPFFQSVFVDHNQLLHAKLDAGTLLVIDLESMADGVPEWNKFHFSTEAFNRMGLGLKEHPRLMQFEMVRTIGDHTLVFRKMDDRIFRYPSVKLAFSRFWTS